MILAAAMPWQNASAAILAYDGFDYPIEAALNGYGSNAFRWSTNRWTRDYATSDFKVFAGGLQFSNLPVNGGGIRETNTSHGADYHRQFQPLLLADGECLWFSFLIRVTQGASWSFHVATDQNASKIGVQGAYVDYLLRARIGVGDNGSTNALDLGQNKVRFIVGRYQYRAAAPEQLDIWLDPDPGAEPTAGGLSTTNHLVYRKELTTDPNRRDRLLFSDRSIGAVELDEFRIGTTWSDIVARPVDTPFIKSLAINGGLLQVSVERLTIGATNRLESTSTLRPPIAWEVLTTFVPVSLTTNLSLPKPGNSPALFVRVLAP